MHAKNRPTVQRIVELGLGFALILLAPVVGVIPGPGGLFVFAAGLWLVLRNSCKARRLFVRLKRRWPRADAFIDKALQRKSAMRRRLREKARGRRYAEQTAR